MASMMMDTSKSNTEVGHETCIPYGLERRRDSPVFVTSTLLRPV